jgi:hypothetical protein
MSAPKPPGDDLAWKLIFSALFADAEAQLETEKEVGQLARTINGIVEIDEAALLRLRELMPFPELNLYNALEGKGKRDPLTQEDYHRILGRVRFYAAELRLEHCSRLSVYICCVRKPRKLLTKMPHLAKFTPLGNGIYRADEKFPVYVICVSECSPDARNGLLCLMGTPEQKREAVRVLLREGKRETIAFLEEVFPQTLAEVRPMAKRDDRGLGVDWDANIDFYIERLGKEQVLSHFRPEDLAARLKPEDRVAGLKPEDIVSNLSPSERARLLRLLQEETPAPTPPRRGKGKKQGKRS